MLHRSLKKQMKLIKTLKPSFIRSSKKPKAQNTTSFTSNASSSSSSGSLSFPPKLTRQELERVLRRLGPDPPTEAEILEMLAEADSMSVDDIVALGSGVGPESEELEEAFRVFDTDGDGKISAEELMGLFVMIGDEDCGIEECRRMIDGVDYDGDGFVCFEDFVRMMMEMER